MKQRYIPFGYTVKDGENICEPIEEKAVRSIFAQYQNDATYQAIAMQMSAKGICYHTNKTAWNKNMVKRILENKCYLGNADYPAIITPEQFDKIAFKKACKKESFVSAPPCIAAIRPTVYCHQCGGRLIRKIPSKGYGKWYCESDGCTTTIRITDTLLKSTVTTILNMAIENPSLIKTPTVQEMPLSLEITRLHNEINREIDKADCNEDYVKKLIMACAVEKYNLCDDGSPQRISRKIKDIFTNHVPITELDTDLFTATVDKVLVYQDGNININLKNNQMLGKDR